MRSRASRTASISGHMIRQRFRLHCSIDANTDTSPTTLSFPASVQVNPAYTIVLHNGSASRKRDGSSHGAYYIHGYDVSPSSVDITWVKGIGTSTGGDSDFDLEIVEFASNVSVQVIETTQDWQTSSGGVMKSASIPINPVNPLRSILVPLWTNYGMEIGASYVTMQDWDTCGGYNGSGHIHNLYIADDGETVELIWGSGHGLSERPIGIAVLEVR
jgi:hypothetical protein